MMKATTPIILFALLVSFVLLVSFEKGNAGGTPGPTEGLSARHQSLVVISALTAAGDMEKLTPALNRGLDAGLTINEIKEALVQLYAYCGFPRSLNAINTLKTVVEERRSKSIRDTEGRPGIVENKSTEKYEQGRRVIETLTKVPQAKPAPGYGAFAPRIDLFLKEHLFADIFINDVLTYQERELVTTAALATIPGLESQLRSHINICKNLGISEAQLEEVAALIEANVSRTQANVVRKMLSKPAVPVVGPDLMVRIAEIEIYSEHLDAYRKILKDEAAASVHIEPGVIAIFPMYQKEHPHRVRIVEIYASRQAYEAHLQTPHFQTYKSSTLKMVKSLTLVDMGDVDTDTMVDIFQKLQ